MLHIELIPEDQIHAAGEILAQAFFNDPLCLYAEPNPEARIRGFGRFFTELVREGADMGEVYECALDDQPVGVAVWMPPWTGDAGEEAAAGSAQNHTKQLLGPAAARRFSDAYRHFEQVHHRLMTKPHWLLTLLGVSPCCQRQGIGGALLAPRLQRADREDIPCYLETFVPANVPFYEHHGFRVIDAGVEPQSRIPFWSMAREPHA
jgi:GNAT superfamily N-acetyltransferase